MPPLLQLLALPPLLFSVALSASNNVDEALRYAKLPPTVFAPDGRLFGVERVAREAITSSPAAEEDSTSSSCTVFAIRCGARDNRGELAVMVGIGPVSPSLHRDSVELYLRDQEAEDENDNEETSFYKSLLIEDEQKSSSPALPISILSSTLITAAGGKSIDSAALLRRSIEVALSIYQSDNGGIDFFASHSLEGMAPMIGGGGAAGVTIEGLVRRIADMAQSSTQNLGGRSGRMLASSLLAVGVQQNNQSCNIYEDDKLCIWRVDPTGQFWKCDASAAGRGMYEVEAELLSRVRLWKKNGRLAIQGEENPSFNNKDDDMDVIRITNHDIRSYLSSLAEDEAVDLAIDCLVNGIMNCKGTIPSHNHSNAASLSLKEWMEYDLKRRIECVILRSTKRTSMNSCEIVRRL